MMTTDVEQPGSAPVVQMQGVSKHFRDAVALHDVNLELRRGEIVGLLGPNAAGKTTLMRLLLGLVAPTSGTVTVLGGSSRDGAVLRRVGAMIESPAFVPGLSGRDNLRVCALAKGVGADEVDSCLERVQLSDAARRKFKVYSLGMKQRLALAQALLGRPELLVVDEPMNGLDPQGVVDMRALVSRLAEEGQTILISSHQLHEVQQVCSKVIILNRGRVVASGPLEELGGDDLERAFFNLLGTDGSQGAHA